MAEDAIKEQMEPRFEINAKRLWELAKEGKSAQENPPPFGGFFIGRARASIALLFHSKRNGDSTEPVSGPGTDQIHLK